MANEELNYAEVVEGIFNDNEWNFTVKRREDETIFFLPFSAKNVPGLNLRFIVDDDGDCKIRCYLAKNVPDTRRVAMLDVLNRLNSRYRYITLSIDSDGDVLASYDFKIFGDAETADRQVGTMIFFVSKIMDDCVPKIMKVVWQDDDDD